MAAKALSAASGAGMAAGWAQARALGVHADGNALSSMRLATNSGHPHLQVLVKDSPLTLHNNVIEEVVMCAASCLCTFRHAQQPVSQILAWRRLIRWWPRQCQLYCSQVWLLYTKSAADIPPFLVLVTQLFGH